MTHQPLHETGTVGQGHATVRPPFSITLGRRCRALLSTLAPSAAALAVHACVASTPALAATHVALSTTTAFPTRAHTRGP